MKKYMILLLMIVPIATVIGQETGFKLEGVGSATLPVTLNKMTNIVFPGPIRSAVKVSRDILAQKVRGAENVIEVKAMRKGFSPTNLSVYDADGHLYSFLLKYVDDTPTLNYRVIPSDGRAAGIRLTGLPVDENKLRADAEQLAGGRGFMHVKSRSARLRLTMKGIWFRDSLQWLVFNLDNRSFVAYRPTQLQFYLKDVGQINRRAAQEQELHPVYPREAHTLPGHQAEDFAVAFEPFTIPKGKRLIVRLQGQDGRMLVLRIKGRLLLRARAA